MDTKLKIGLLTDNYPHSGGAGGIGTYTQLVGEELARLGHNVHVFTFADVPQRQCREVNGVHVWECLPWSKRRQMSPRQALEFTVRYRNSAYALNRYAMALAVQEARKSGQFDVIESPEIGALGGFVRSKRYTKRFAVRLHKPAGIENASQGLPPVPAPIREAERTLAQDADVLTVPTAAAREDIQDYWGIPLEQAQVIGNPVRGVPPRVKLAGPPRMSSVFFGRLEKQKGVDTLAAAIGHIRAGKHDYCVDFYGADAHWPGGGTGAETIARVARGTGGDGGFRVHPPVKHDDLMAAIRKSAVCVLPSRSETFGMCFLEAMMWGVPCVVSKINAFQELAQSGVHCLFADTEEPKSFADQICRLLEDSTMASQIAENGYLHAQNWSVPHVTSRMIDAWLS